jgi:hypothetical protein
MATTAQRVDLYAVGLLRGIEVACAMQCTRCLSGSLACAQKTADHTFIGIRGPLGTPPPVDAIEDLVGMQLPILDFGLRLKIGYAMVLPNCTPYQSGRPMVVDAWLAAHTGDRLFLMAGENPG